jgi:predicted AAA+ superfamily ATPase
LLEGSAEAKPRNVLFYAASNRRHNLPLGWNAGEDANMAGDREDAVLADRFGLTVTFPNLSQTEYLEIVKVLAGRRGLMLDAQFMADQAVKWAGSQEVTGRMARQFVDHIANEMART